jgi:hypothetical protein
LLFVIVVIVGCEEEVTRGRKDSKTEGRTEGRMEGNKNQRRIGKMGDVEWKRRTEVEK